MSDMTRPLQFLRSRSRLTAWLGVVLVCAQLLAGGVSNWHMVQRLANAAGLQALCSSSDTVRTGGREPSPAQQGLASQHCPFCLTASDLPLLPTASLAVLLPPAHRMAAQILPVGVAPRPLVLRHARTRAPPFFV